MSTENAEVAAILRHIAELLQTLPAEIAASQGTATTLSKDDRERLAKVCQAVDNQLGASSWTVTALIGRADRCDEIRDALAGISGRSLGKLFARAHGTCIDVDGFAYRICRGRETRMGLVWHVERLSNPH